MLDWLFSLPTALAETAGAAVVTDSTAGEQVGGLASLVSMFLPMILIVGVFYFLMIRPQRKKDKKVKDMLAALKPGDRICTIGGIYATIKGLRENEVILSVGRDNTEIVVARWAIRNVEEVSVENEGELLT